MEMIGDHPETPPGCVVLAVKNAYYFIDPMKDYISVKTIHMRTENGNRRKIMESSFTEFSHLSNGQWYPQERHMIIYEEPLSQRWPHHEVSENISFKLLSEVEFPSDVFDIAILLEGATVETY